MELNYHSVRNQIQDGDAFLFEPPAGINPQRLISWWTRSPYVHVGMAVWAQTGPVRRLFCLEAQLGVGVRLETVSDYLLQGRRIHWYTLDDKAFTAESAGRRAMVEFGFSQLGRNYIPEWKLVLDFLLLGRPPKKVRALRASCRRPVWFCSQLYSTELQAAKIALPGNILPYHASPETVAEYPFLNEQGTLALSAGV